MKKPRESSNSPGPWTNLVNEMRHALGMESIAA